MSAPLINVETIFEFDLLRSINVYYILACREGTSSSPIVANNNYVVYNHMLAILFYAPVRLSLRLSIR